MFLCYFSPLAWKFTEVRDYYLFNFAFPVLGKKAVQKYVFAKLNKTQSVK